VVRQPVSSGPFWFGRFQRPKRSWPSRLKAGTKSIAMRSSTERQAPSESISRKAMKPASLPSLSPGWMPAWSMRSGTERGSARETTRARIARPSAEWPNSRLCTSRGQAAANAVHSRATSSLRPVWRKPDCSAMVVKV